MNEKPKEISTSAPEAIVLSEHEQAALAAVSGGSWKKYTRVAMAALGGVPWVGSVLSAAAALSAENEQGETNKILFLWVQEHEQKLKDLGITLSSIFERFNSFGESIKSRIESSEYLTIVRKAFRQWDQAETAEKREMLKKLVTNSGAITLSQDDLIMLFLEWIGKYHEFHFLVIREIYKNPSITRGGIWENTRGEFPREDSAEADLFKLLIRDLSTGGIIRQEAETDDAGNFMKKRSVKRSSKARSTTKKSAFEDTEPYVLTALGSQFVHYVMDDVATQIAEGK